MIENGASRREYPFADTRAAKMLSDALRAAAERDGRSQRQLARELGHKQPSMLSQWASGRVPIPIERAAELSNALLLDGRAFLLAVLSQRHPDVAWDVIEDENTPAYSFVSGLQTIAGKPIEEFEPGQLKVMREAAADPRADRRWLSVHEVPVIDLVRKLRPGLAEHGLETRDLNRIRDGLPPSDEC